MSMRRSGGLGEWAAFGAVAVAIVAAALVLRARAQGITIPNTFVNATVADANQVNANFTALAGNALNRNSGTMLGTLNARDVIPTASNTYALGSVALQWKTPFISGGTSGQFLSTDGAGTTSWATPTAPPPVSIGTCDLRLSSTTGVAYPATEVAAATNVYVAPTRGGQCAFFDGTATWTMLTNSQVTIAVPATTNTLYDVFCRNSSGTIACDLSAAWTSVSARFASGAYAALHPTQNSVYVKSTDGTVIDSTRRYIGSFSTSGVSGQTSDTLTARLIWSYYDRVGKHLLKQESTASWTYNVATIHQANGAAANQLDFVVGVNEVAFDAMTQVLAANATVATSVLTGVGLDSTTAFCGEPGGAQIQSANNPLQITGRCKGFAGIGKHSLMWLENVSVAAGATTFYATGGVTGNTAGISAWLLP